MKIWKNAVDIYHLGITITSSLDFGSTLPNFSGQKAENGTNETFDFFVHYLEIYDLHVRET